MILCRVWFYSRIFEFSGICHGWLWAKLWLPQSLGTSFPESGHNVCATWQWRRRIVFFANKRKQPSVTSCNSFKSKARQQTLPTKLYPLAPLHLYFDLNCSSCSETHNQKTEQTICKWHHCLLSSPNYLFPLFVCSSRRKERCYLSANVQLAFGQLYSLSSFSNLCWSHYQNVFTNSFQLWTTLLHSFPHWPFLPQPENH